ncbi:H-NS histone family protein [Salinimonas sediminis]|uniref:DNA-binding protein n=1 Tax=Salinimonas sediminis TaxID=2303538 RepID=A0A346NLH0_9ALTE|nr:H-NS family nucleoid-associated regulatory protein [Salinimonas sediminis]AXR06377.1 H-NS histone family protein [Salinimonas sediminis]
MSEFLEILTHGRRLQGAVKELSLAELEAVQEKLGNIIEKRREKAAEDQEKEQEKLAKIAEIQQQLQAAGLDVSDLEVAPAQKAQPRKTGKKRPVKFILTDKTGQEHKWTGIGRMPKVFKEAIDSGKKLEDYSI